MGGQKPEQAIRIKVTADGPGMSRGVLVGPRGPCACALGRAGARRDKREGDGATPAGVYPLRRVLYRPDRGGAPQSGLPVAPIAPTDGWCDDPLHESYNCQVRLPFPASAEQLWREDAVYDRIVVVGYNDDPPVPHLGSAIFIHIATDDFQPTEGCIAVAFDDLTTLIELARPGDLVDIREGRD